MFYFIKMVKLRSLKKITLEMYEHSREETEFCRQHYYLVMALSRVSSMLKMKLFKVYK